MKKQLVIIGIVALLVSVGLSGCNSSPKDKIIGEWVNQEDEYDTYTFYENGSVYRTSKFGMLPDEYWTNYTIGENNLIIGDRFIVPPNNYVFTFSDNDNQLILDSDVYNRQ